LRLGILTTGFAFRGIGEEFNQHFTTSASKGNPKVVGRGKNEGV